MIGKRNFILSYSLQLSTQVLHFMAVTSYCVLGSECFKLWATYTHQLHLNASCVDTHTKHQLLLMLHLPVRILYIVYSFFVNEKCWLIFLFVKLHFSLVFFHQQYCTLI